MVGMTGCSLIPELSLTDEQSELIAEYAAGLLVKYQSGHTMGLTPVSAADLVDKTETVTDEDIAAEPVADSDSGEDMPEPENVGEAEDPLTDNPEDGTIETVSSTLPISAVFGLDGFDISLSGYEFTTVYPEDESADLVFSMQATPGSKLLIVHFAVQNTSDSQAECSPINANVKARAIVNNSGSYNAQATILDNDLLNFDMLMEAGDSSDAVLVFEVPEDLDSSLSSLDITLTGAEGENLYHVM